MEDLMSEYSREQSNLKCRILRNGISIMLKVYNNSQAIISELENTANSISGTWKNM